MLKYALTLLPLLLLAACSTPGKQYQGSDAAKVVITNHVNYSAFGGKVGSAGGNLILTTFPNASDCSGGEQHFPEIGGGALEQSPSTSVPISLEPNKERAMQFFAMFNAYGRNYNCYVMISFIPKPKADYEIVFTASPSGCNAPVMQKINGQLFPDKTAKNRKITPGFGSRCEKL